MTTLTLSNLIRGSGKSDCSNLDHHGTSAAFGPACWCPSFTHMSMPVVNVAVASSDSGWRTCLDSVVLDEPVNTVTYPAPPPRPPNFATFIASVKYL
jgi:hypothetical protein